MANARKSVDKALTEISILDESIEKYKSDIRFYEDCLLESGQLLQLIQESVRLLYSTVSTKIGDTITEGINLVWPDSPYKFIVEFVERRNNVEADLYLIDNDGERYDPTREVGGGISDFISLLFRIVYIKLSKYEDILLADEPLKFIDRERIEEASEFVRKLCEELSFQILMITHIPEMIKSSETVYHVTKRNKISTIEKL